MANGDDSINLTRREFYSAMSCVWVYILLIIGNQLRTDERWSSVILFVASFFMTIVYVVKIFRSMSVAKP